MDFQGLLDRLKAVDAPGLLGTETPRVPDPENKKDKGRAGDPTLLVDPQCLVDLLRVCRDDPSLDFDILMDLCGADPAAEDENLWVVVHLLSTRRHHRLAIKALVPKSNPKLPSTVPVYRASQWHERECSEMFGIAFEGHPDPRHILLPTDWVGHPLRKDYEFPKEYHGISCE